MAVVMDGKEQFRPENTTLSKVSLQMGSSGLLEEDSLSDISIKVKDRTFNCQKSVLCAVSPYFRAMFQREFKEKSQGVITMHGIEPDIFETIIQFLYGKDNTFSESNAEDMLRASTILQIECLQRSCEEFMLKHISSGNCLGLWKLACFLSCKTLASKSKSYVVEHFEEVCKHEEFIELSNEELIEIIKDDSLKTKYEENVSDAAMKWILMDKTNRQMYLSNVFKHIRLPLASSEYLIQFIWKYSDLFAQESCSYLLIEAQKYRMLPGQRQQLSSIRSYHRECYPLTNAIIATGSSGSAMVMKLTTSGIIGKDLSWKSVCSMHYEPEAHFAVCSFNDDIYISGGLAYKQYHFTRYNTIRNKWTLCKDMPTARAMHGMVALRNSVFIVGGSSINEEFLSRIDRYDIASEGFDEAGDLLVAVRNMSVVSLNELIYIFGGESKTAERTDKIQCFDIRNGQCSNIGHLPYPVAYSYPACIDDEFYFCFSNGALVRIRLQDGFKLTTLHKFEGLKCDQTHVIRHLNSLYIFDRIRSRRSSKINVVDIDTGDVSLVDISLLILEDDFVHFVQCVVPNRYFEK